MNNKYYALETIFKFREKFLSKSRAWIFDLLFLQIVKLIMIIYIDKLGLLHFSAV